MRGRHGRRTGCREARQVVGQDVRRVLRGGQVDAADAVAGGLHEDQGVAGGGQCQSVGEVEVLEHHRDGAVGVATQQPSGRAVFHECAHEVCETEARR